MKLQNIGNVVHLNDIAYRGVSTRSSISESSTTETTTALLLATARLMKPAERRQRRCELTDEEYYQPSYELEETIECAPAHRVFDAKVTRNHYGSLILNAQAPLFIDVDVETSGGIHDPKWSETFEDLCTVLGSERSDSFRIYRTAAGFRVLATAREFVPGSEISKRLMNSVGADTNFVDLCGRQNNFRARLSPKPWRCGITRPPFVYPRITLEHEHASRRGSRSTTTAAKIEQRASSCACWVDACP